MISVTHLNRHYGDFIAVDDVSFDIPKGEIVGLLGHNGAGKTTIMKMLTGFLEPTSGTIKIDDREIQTHPQEVQKEIGYLPENCPVWPDMTVIDYLDFQATLHAVPKDEKKRAIARVIRLTSLKEKAKDPIRTLSRGYRQRVGVAQALLHRPKIVILDEPTNGLDPTQIQHMRELISDLSEISTVILSTHILQEVQAVCDRVLIMRSGKLIVDAKLCELQKGHQIEVVTSNPASIDYLRAIPEVGDVSVESSNEEKTIFFVTTEKDISHIIGKSVYDNGDTLFLLKPRIRNLERLFSDINSNEKIKEVKNG